MTQIQHIIQRKKHLLVLVIAAFLMSMSSCKKDPVTPSDPYDPNTLPPLTHQGKNTFGCLVNGEVWVAYAPFTVGGTTSLNGSYHANIGGLHLTANRKIDSQNESSQIDLVVLDVFETGEYMLHDANEEQKGFLDYLGNHSCAKYYYRDSLQRRIVITYFSLSKGVMSGTFEMDLVNPSCPGDTVRIREGRFDWRF